MDRAGFEGELTVARERSKGASKVSGEGGLPKDGQIDPSWTTEFRGYPSRIVSLEGARCSACCPLSAREKVDS